MRTSGTRSWHALLTIITAGVLIPTELPAQPRPASCGVRGIFCANCATPVSIATRKNTPCTIPYWAPGGGAIFSQRVTKRGSGIYGTANPTAGAYQPKPGYVGKDYFEVEVSYERSGTKLKTTLQVNVTITN